VSFSQAESSPYGVIAALQFSRDIRQSFTGYLLRRSLFAGRMQRHVLSYPYEESLERRRIYSPGQSFGSFRPGEEIQTGQQVTQ